MNDAQEHEFKHRLLALKAELEARHDHNQAALDTVELDHNRVGRLSRMDVMQGQQMAQEAERHRLRKLQQVDGALRRLAQGLYGLCFVCDQAIALERLRFDPTLTRCVTCSEED
ncbi:TraR/DksA family transcriptional regulator [Marinicella meishanensis]|uniref:TraR/DksA family transcriptional regulator n=1 Tax=Marinicella meishanensis TaxID=2873263 RepID=UPI001CBAF75D|nr:TraR/DksA C4-type zinc finger protein [Marinicella sp. NBU2979]